GIKIIHAKARHGQQLWRYVDHVRHINTIRRVLSVAIAHAGRSQEVVDGRTGKIIRPDLLAAVRIDIINIALWVYIVYPGIPGTIVDEISAEIIDSHHQPVAHVAEGEVTKEVLLYIGCYNVALLIADPQAEFAQAVFVVVQIRVVTF